MTRTFLSTSVLLAAGLAMGQTDVVVQVLSPASILDSYANTFATSANSWGVADLTIPANSVQGDLWSVTDGTAADSLGCETLTNAADVAGKIAVVYRGTCPFGVKALNAQNAGALAVLIINNQDGLNFTMLGGTEGLSVTIPVAMIAQSSGAVIRPVLDVEPVTAFIGNNFAAFPNNLHLDGEDLLVPSASSVPSIVAVDASEYQVQIGAFIHNFGSETQTTARLRATVTQDGTELYNEVSDNNTLMSGDSVFVQLDQFTQPTYSGTYSILYSVESDVEDAFTNDDSYAVPLTFGEVVSYAPVDPVTGIPVSTDFVAPATPTGAFRTCIQFNDTNASRLSITGLYFAAQSPTDLADPQDSALTDLLVTTFAYLWTDAITGANALPSDGGLSTLTSGSYSFPSDLQREAIFIPFEEVIQLDDNQHYLFCAETAETFVRHGWNEDVDYATNGSFGFIDPTSMLRDGADWFNGFIGLAGSPSLGVKVIDTNTIGIAENSNKVDITPYPNPTNDFLNIPLKGFTGAAMLQMFDMNGAKVAEQKVAVGGNNLLNVDVKGISAGTYMFHLQFENGKRSDFRVVVAK